ncbi:hypothetical protein [Paracoccus sp. NSM]|uniref:hypothetical protein n=1 Tax=Paracoccus sp. NSM TaxID=3457784 RepID=UPI004035FA9E
MALADPMWRICSGVLYKIMVKGDDQDDSEIGQLEPFLPNVNQLRFLADLHFRNTILKARQLGFTTLGAVMGFDRAAWTPNQRCGIIADEKDKASAILRDKVFILYENLPEPLRAKMPLAKRSETELQFAHNNSSIRVAISMRGGTIHFLHISELGKIAAKYPAKAREVQTGSLPAVPKSGIVTIESTAEGAEGLFFDMTSRAEAQHIARQPLNRGDYRFHFFPWYLEPGYVAEPRHVRISLKQHEYFDKIEAETGATLTMPQRAWYVNKLEADFSGDHQLMKQEMPSTPAEAWSRSTAGTYLTAQLNAARAAGRIGKVPHIASLPVHTFWDIGAGDGTGIWLMQQVGLASHFIRYVEDWGKGYAHYVRILRETGFIFGGMYLPHDANAERQLADKIGAPIGMLQDLAPDWNWQIVPRVHDFQAGIDMLRQRFPEAWFDEEGCKEGITHLSLYRKKYNTATKTFRDEPEKYDGHSEAADALRQWAQGFTPSHATGERRKQQRRRSGMTA